MVHQSLAVSRRFPLTGSFWWATAVAACAGGIGVLVTRSRTEALALTLLLLLFALLMVVPGRYVVAALIIYLPLQGWLTGLVPGTASSVVRYAPEGICVLALAVAAASRAPKIDRWRPLTAVLLLTVACWVISGIAAGETAPRVLIGVRAELRWVPLGLLVALSSNISRDARVYGRAIVAAAFVQSLIAVAELVIGTPAKLFFAPQYNVVLGGVTVTQSQLHENSLSGTLNDYNSLGTCLVMGWIVVMAAGGTRLGIPRWMAWAAGLAFPALTVVSGSRESVLAFLCAGLVIARIRYRLPVMRTVVLAAVVIAAGFPVVASSTTTKESNNGNSLGTRFAVLLNPQTYKVDSATNFRLALLASDARLTLDREPVLGFGVGSIMDPRSLVDGSNPLFLTTAGRIAIESSYLYDGNWGIILTETGVFGLMCVAVLLLWMFRLGLRVSVLRVPPDWVGVALVAMTVSAIVLGFFESVLQLPEAAATYWVVCGASLALLASGDSVERGR